MKPMSLMMSLCLACAGAFAGPVAVETTVVVTPDGATTVAPAGRVIDQPNAFLNALKQNDFAAFQEATKRDQDIVAIAKDWDERAERLRANREKRAAESAAANIDIAQSAMDDPMQQYWLKLRSAEGIDLLVAEWQPKIAADVGQRLLEFNLGFGAALTALASDQQLSAHEVQQLTQLMYAVQNWTARVDFADAERLRRALQAASSLVRQTGLKRYDDAETLSFEDAIVHGDTLIVVIKQMFAAYDINIDEILNSVRFNEIDALGDRATLHAEARVFGVDISHDFKMQYFEGQWMGVDAVETQQLWREKEAKQADEAAKATVEIEAPTTPASISSPSSCRPDTEFDGVVDAAGDAK